MTLTYLALLCLQLLYFYHFVLRGTPRGMTRCCTISNNMRNVLPILHLFLSSPSARAGSCSSSHRQVDPTGQIHLPPPVARFRNVAARSEPSPAAAAPRCAPFRTRHPRQLLGCPRVLAAPARLRPHLLLRGRAPRLRDAVASMPEMPAAHLVSGPPPS